MAHGLEMGTFLVSHDGSHCESETKARAGEGKGGRGTRADNGDDTTER